MIKNSLFIGLTIFSFSLSAQNFAATYSFASVTSTTGTTDPSAVPQVAGLSFGSFSATGTSTNPNASGRFSFTKMPLGGIDGVDTYSSFTGALSPTVYYEVKIKVLPNYTLSLTTINFGIRRSSTGIRNYAVRSDKDNYVSNLPSSVGNNAKLSVVNADVFFWNFDSVSTAADQKGSRVTLITPFDSITDSITFRFYGWNAEANGGTFSIDNVGFFGTATDTMILPNPEGINEQAFDAVNVGPIPPDEDMVTIFDNRKIVTLVEIMDALGNRLLTYIPLFGESRIILSTVKIPAGNYFLKIYSGEKSCLRKLVLNK